MRQEWMGVLSRADAAGLALLWNRIEDKPAYGFLRSPEPGLIMVRGRAGGSGRPFNLGEMVVTRCSVRLEGGAVGHAYIAGRGRQQAEQAAILDAMLQDPDRHGEVDKRIIEPLKAAEAETRRCKVAKSAATRVDFMTVVRGEDE